MATHLARRHAASLAISLAPLDHRRNSHRETGSHNTCRLAGNNSCYCTLPKIIRIGFYHACRPPVPARSLNHNSTKNGIPRFKQMMNRSSVVKDVINESAGHPDLSAAKEASAKLATLVNRAKDELLSTLSLALDDAPDEFLERLKKNAQDIEIQTYAAICRAILPGGRMMSRDSNAMMAGLQLAPHQEIVAETAALQSPCDAATNLSEIVRRAGSHMDRKEKGKQRSKRIGTNVFIGHGRFTLWRELRECPEFCVCVPVHGGFKYSHALKRSSNIIANWLRAANHSRTFLPPFSKLRMAR